MTIKKFNITKLLVGDTEDADIAVVWEEGLNSLDVDGGILHAGTMTHVDGKLEHRKTVFLNVLAKQSVGFDVFFRLCGQIKKNKYPHDMVFVKSFNHLYPFLFLHRVVETYYMEGYEILLDSPLKHWARVAVVCATATISGLRLSSMTTSRVGITRSFAFRSFVSSV